MLFMKNDDVVQSNTDIIQNSNDNIQNINDSIQNNNSIKKERIVYFDILNILAIIAVVALHCNGIVHNNPNRSAWDSSLIVECLFYWAVPVFLMLSGATLMKYRERYDTKTFFKKRFLRVLIPFIFWATFMFVWKIFTKQMNFEDVNSVKKLLNAFLANKEESTYYFMFNIIGIYLTMPLLSLLAKEENRKTLWFTVLLFFIFNSTFPNILPLFGITYNNSLTIQIGGYIVFVFLGYLLSTQDLKKSYRILLYISAILGLVYRYSTTFILSKLAGQVVKTTWSYTSWHSILLACAVFVFVKNLKINEKIKQNKNITNILKVVSSCSLGIYLMHKVAMYYQTYLLIIDVTSWQWRTLGIISTYFICLIIVYILKKIPVL